MVYCQRCGRKLDEAHLHCPYCGVLQERELDGEKNLVVSVKKRSLSTLIIVLIVGMIKRSLSTVRHQEKLRKIRPSSRLDLNLKKMLRI